MIPIAVVVVLVAGDASALTDEQAERCAPPAEAQRSAEGRSYLTVEAKEVGIADARRAMERCLLEVEQAPWPAWVKRARRRCPCKEGAVEWNDEEGVACRPVLENYYSTLHLFDTEYNPLMPAIREQQIGQLRARLADCFSGHRADLARQKAMAAEAAARERLHEEQRRSAEAARSEEAEREQQEKIASQSPPDGPTARKLRVDALTIRSCYVAAKRKEARARLEEEKRGARYGGVVDKSVLHEWSGVLVIMDLVEAASRRDAAALHAKPRKCPPPQYDEVATCIDDHRGSDLRYADVSKSENQIEADLIFEAAWTCTPR